MMHYDINVCCTTHFTGLLFQPLCKARFGNVHSAWSSIEKIVRECVFTFEPFFIEYSEPFVAFCILIWDYKIFAFTVFIFDLPYVSSEFLTKGHIETILHNVAKIGPC